MKVYIPEYSSFCPGVKLAEKNLFEKKTSDPFSPIYVLGQLIHNNQYSEFLSREGIQTVESENEIPKASTTVIRTHGIDRKLEEKLRKNLKIVDLTCNKVKHLQKIIFDHAEKRYFVIITGKKDHPEVTGLRSYAKDHFIVEDEAGIVELERIFQDSALSFIKGNYCRILIVSQTTGNRSLFEKTAEKVHEICPQNCEIKIHDSICSITSIREKESVRLQKRSDVTFVIGDRSSANANKLYEKLKMNQENTYFIENLKELFSLNLPMNQYQSSLVVSSSSTPEFVEKEVIEYLASL